LAVSTVDPGSQAVGGAGGHSLWSVNEALKQLVRDVTVGL